MSATLLRAAFVTALLAVLAIGRFGAQQPPAPIVLPVERASNVFFVRATLNGVGPLWFTVDTGATLTVIDPATAKRAGLALRDLDRRPNVGVADGDTDIAQVRGATIAIDGLPPFRPDALYVVPVKGNAPILGHTIDGVLGTDVLQRYVVRFDYAASRVVLISPVTMAPAVGPMSVAVTLERNVLIAPATLTLPDAARVPARLLVDTGSSGALTLTTPFVRRHQLGTRLPRQPRIEASATVGINGTIFSPVVTMTSVAFGDAVIAQPRTTLSQAASGLNASTEFDGIIGAELLRQFTLVVDYPRRRLVFEGDPRR